MTHLSPPPTEQGRTAKTTHFRLACLPLPQRLQPPLQPFLTPQKQDPCQEMMETGLKKPSESLGVVSWAMLSLCFS